jgi:hypothetical protein
MPRLLTSMLVLLLGAWPTRASGASAPVRARRGRRLPSRLGADEQDPIDAPERARARTFGTHHWPGEAIFTAGDRRTVVRGRWRLTLDPMQRAQAFDGAGALSLDPAYAEAWETQLEALLTLQVPGARLRVAGADANGWRLLELRAPTRPETVVQLDRAAVAQVMDRAIEAVTVELRVHA